MNSKPTPPSLSEESVSEPPQTEQNTEIQSDSFSKITTNDSKKSKLLRAHARSLREPYSRSTHPWADFATEPDSEMGELPKNGNGKEKLIQKNQIGACKYVVWLLLHSLFYSVGASCFLAGTWFVQMHADPNNPTAKWAGLYLIGSIGFIFVDIIELLSFKNEFWLCANMLLSFVGNACFVFGSVGFSPVIYRQTDSIGIGGFFLGGLFISVSQFWKIRRILSSAAEWSKDTITFTFTEEVFTVFGIELSSGLGAFFFWIGTIMLLCGSKEEAFFQIFLNVWLTGSILFVVSAIFLLYRHGIMRV